MTNKDYKQCIQAAKNYLFCGRSQYRQITFDDLTTECLIILSENNIPYSLDAFKANIKHARAKMVRELLNSDPNEKRKQTQRVNKWLSENRLKYNASQRAYRKRTYKPTNGKRSVKGGKLHPKYKGLINTPFGTFESSYAAAIALNTNHTAIQRKCKSEKYPDYFIKK